MAIANQRGWRFSKYNARAAAVDRLAQEYNDDSLALGLSVARKFHANFYRDFMEDDEIERDRPLVARFVRRIIAIVEEPDA